MKKKKGKGIFSPREGKIPHKYKEGKTCDVSAKLKGKLDYRKERRRKVSCWRKSGGEVVGGRKKKEKKGLFEGSAIPLQKGEDREESIWSLGKTLKRKGFRTG